LRRAGFDVSALTVQWYVKLAFPLIAPVSMLLGDSLRLPRGRARAIGGVAVGLAVGIGYFSLSRCWKPWAASGSCLRRLRRSRPEPGVYFLGMYFFFKMPT